MPPHEEQRGEVASERRDEQRKEYGPEPATVCATGVGRDDRSPLDPGTGNTARHEERDRTGHGERDAARSSIDPIGYCGSASGVVDVVAGGCGGGTAGGRDAGGASGADSFFFSFFLAGGSAGVSSGAVVVVSSVVVAGAT